MRDKDPASTPKKKKKKPPPTFVELRYPFWVGAVSFGWTIAGWLIAAAAPRLAFVPGISVLNYLFPTITVGLIGLNLFLAIRDLWRGAHPLRLLLVTGLQIGLFTTLYFQLFSHIGADLFEVRGPVSAWHWVVFSFAHAVRASDLVDIVEAYSLRIQPIHHQSYLVAVFLILYHVVVDVFILGVLWNLVNRVKRTLTDSDELMMIAKWTVIVLFTAWLLTWIVAVIVSPWSPIDFPLWLVENTLRVVDFADIMESLDIHLHSLPREGLTGTLTFFCRLWIGLGIALMLGKRKRPAERRLATPPDTAPLPYWLGRAGIIVGILLVVLTVGMVWQAMLGDPVPWLAAAAAEGPEQRTRAALAALRRMGPVAAEATPALVTAQANVPAAEPLRDDFTRTLGYLGPDAIEPLTQIALDEKQAASSAVLAVEGLGRIEPESAAALVRIWSETRQEPVRKQAEIELQHMGHEAVPTIMAATTLANADAHYHWFNELDRNWTIRSTSNPVARALQDFPDVLRRLNTNPEETVGAIGGELRSVGSAAKRATPALIELLQNKKQQVRSGAEGALLAIGPYATPAVLKRRQDLVQANDPAWRPFDESALRLLGNAGMWDESAARDPAALPMLKAMLMGGEKEAAATRPLVMHALALAGAAARDAVPDLVQFLGVADADQRALVRQTLAKIDPGWRKHPDNGRAIPALLPRIALLPKEEQDELLAALGDLPASAVDMLVRAIPPRLGKRDVEKAHNAAVSEGLKILGPRLKAAQPAFAKLLRDPQADFAVRITLIQNLKYIAPDGGEVMPAALAILGTGTGATALFKDLGPDAALPVLAGLLEHNELEMRSFAVRTAAEFGAGARPLLPKIIERLTDKNGFTRVDNKDQQTRPIIFRALAAIDPDWAKHPQAAKALAQVIAGLDADVAGFHAQFVTDVGKLGAAAKPVVPDLAFYTALESLLKREKDPAVRRLADRALEFQRRLKQAGQE
ncbi:MAG: hypothetical protein L0Y71_16720 [Gemmataceae bacterium]|nr:hypothetical protein [Gemmataceae bacterium]